MLAQASPATKLKHMSFVTSGQYNEEAFAGLDYIIERAGFYGIKLILTFSNEWTTADSKTNYLQWGNATDNSNLFFTDPTIQQYYKDHINTMVNRNVSFPSHKADFPKMPLASSVTHSRLVSHHSAFALSGAFSDESKLTTYQFAQVRITSSMLRHSQQACVTSRHAHLIAAH